MTINGVWMTNTHAINVDVRAWDEYECLITVKGLRTCFGVIPNCTHRYVEIGQERTVSRVNIEDFYGNTLIKRTSMK